MSVMQHLLWDTPPSTLTTDVRTPAQASADATRLGLASSLINQYGMNSGVLASAYNNPFYGIPAPVWATMLADLKYPANGRGPLPTYGQQLDQQQTIMNNALSRASAQGAYGSGYANQLMARGVTDYQEGLAKTLADYRLGVLGRIMDAARVQDMARQTLAQSMNFPLSAAVNLFGQSPAQRYQSDFLQGQPSI